MTVSGAITPQGREDVSLLEALTPLVRHWRTVLLWPTLFAVAAAAVSLLMPPGYTATATFTPVASASLSIPSGLAGLAGLAGQLGLPGASAGASTSPDYFAEVLHSREILSKMLLDAFPDPRFGADSALRPLIDIMDVKGKTAQARLEEGIRKLDRQVRTSVDHQTGIVTLQVRLRWAKLVAALANQMVQELNRFNLERRQSQSRAQRQFTEQRLSGAESELHSAEQAQLQFLEANRRYSESPLLAFQAARLERAVQLKQEVYITLSKAYEEARIAEVRDTPVLTVIDAAETPYRRSAPRRTLIVVVAVMLGAVVGLAAAYVRELRENLGREARPDYRAFSTALAEARQQLGAMLRRRI